VGKASVVCRVLHDTGSQRNFVSENIVKLFNPTVIERDIDLIIHGINTEVSVKTNIVTVPITINSESYNIAAIVVPEIDISFKVDNITLIIKGFTEKGYRLADEQLCSSSGTVSDFGMVMGSDAGRILLPATKLLGIGKDSSIYLESDHGVLLMGESSDLLKDLKNLPTLVNPKEVYIDNKCNACSSVVGYGGNLDLSSSVHTSTVRQVLDDNGEIKQAELQKATDEALIQFSQSYLNYDSCTDENYSDMNGKIIEYILSNTERTSTGRLIMPLPWNPECKHLLGMNYNLSKQILNSNLKKLKKDNRLTLYDDVFREQEELGIVERIEDIHRYMENNPGVSFMPHMGVYKSSSESTKLRVVMLSNLCEKNKNQPNAVSHNHALLPGPCLNSKLITSLMLSRFDKYILIFDIRKAFLGIQLRECDQNKLLCLWYKNVAKGDFSLIAFKNLRLSFGLRPSPSILMLALHKMMLIDVENDDQDTIALKRLIYQNIYMDNGLVSASDPSELLSHYNKLPVIFGEYEFELQQYATNCKVLQTRTDTDMNSETDKVVKFFGVEWDREADSLGPYPINLDGTANTKRKVLSTLNSVYDLFNIYGPILNRSKLYLQRLQCDKSLEWDSVLPSRLLEEWTLICRQANATPRVTIDRFVGSRAGSFTLVAFSDASGSIYGTVVYIIERETNKVSFLLAKNRVVKDKSRKTIPSLECQGVVLAVETLMDIYKELCGDKNILPLDINSMFVYTDSMVTLSWIKNYFISHDKMQGRSVYIMNRLKELGDWCKLFPITFRYIAGHENPADYISRPTSYNTLKKTDYYHGPAFLREMESQPDLEVTVPNILSEDSSDGFDLNEQPTDTAAHTSSSAAMVCGKNERQNAPVQHLLQLDKFSSFNRMVRICAWVIKFINNLKRKASIKLKSETEANAFISAKNTIIRTEQFQYFPAVVQFFKASNLPVNKIPSLVLQMNLYLDDNGIVRVKSKFDANKHPILLPSNSDLVKLIVTDLHRNLSHAGLYTVLKELRRTYWVLRGFSTVRKIIKPCIVCRRINARPIKLNQNSYRPFRCDPPQIPFRALFIDYIGPINVRIDGKQRKIWLLILTCLWSRAISLQICMSADTNEFLRALQMHVYQFGLFQSCLSDLGSQLVAGASIVAEFLDDVNCHRYFQENGINKITFEQYAKGNSSLGSLVENCVKQTKSLMVKSIGKTILSYPEFQLLVAKTMNILNRRPVAFKDGLRDCSNKGDFPEPISPEMLLFGRELLSSNLIPDLQPDGVNDPSFEPIKNIRQNYNRLKIVNEKLVELYHSEFITNLISQATDRRDRYKPVRHEKLQVGDIVLLVEPHTKQSNYPMGIVRKVNVNSIDEVTSAVVFKGGTREEVFRHATSLILLMRSESDKSNESNAVTRSVPSIPDQRRSRRKAANRAREKISELNENDDI